MGRGNDAKLWVDHEKRCCRAELRLQTQQPRRQRGVLGRGGARPQPQRDGFEATEERAQTFLRPLGARGSDKAGLLDSRAILRIGPGTWNDDKSEQHDKKSQHLPQDRPVIATMGRRRLYRIGSCVIPPGVPHVSRRRRTHSNHRRPCGPPAGRRNCCVLAPPRSAVTTPPPSNPSTWTTDGSSSPSCAASAPFAPGSAGSRHSPSGPLNTSAFACAPRRARANSPPPTAKRTRVASTVATNCPPSLAAVAMQADGRSTNCQPAGRTRASGRGTAGASVARVGDRGAAGGACTQPLSTSSTAMLAPMPRRRSKPTPRPNAILTSHTPPSGEWRRAEADARDASQLQCLPGIEVTRFMGKCLQHSALCGSGADNFAGGSKAAPEQKRLRRRPDGRRSDVRSYAQGRAARKVGPRASVSVQLNAAWQNSAVLPAAAGPARLHTAPAWASLE